MQKYFSISVFYWKPIIFGITLHRKYVLKLIKKIKSTLANEAPLLPAFVVIVHPYIHNVIGRSQKTQ